MRAALLVTSGLAISGTLAAPDAVAFWDGPHARITAEGLGSSFGSDDRRVRFLRPHVHREIVDEHAHLDAGVRHGSVNKGKDQYHFDDCEFDGGARFIRNRYGAFRRSVHRSRVQTQIGVWNAVDMFGRVLHPAQDFYSHSNWVELGFPRSDLRNTAPIEVGVSDLVDLSGAPSLGRQWFAPRFGAVVRGDILLGADDGGIIPSSWSINEGPAFVPSLADGEGRIRGRLLTSGMSTGDAECNVYARGGLIRKFKGFSHAVLNKDGPGRTGGGHQRAVALATLQTGYEWCRLVREAGRAGADGLVLTTWIRDRASPHPAKTPCAPAAPGPKEVKVAVESVRMLRTGDGRERGEIQLATALYDSPYLFRRSAHRTTPRPLSLRRGGSVPRNRLPEPVTVCVGTNEGASFALHGWDNDQDRSPRPFGDHPRDATDFDNRGDDDDLLVGFQAHVLAHGSDAPTSYLRTARSRDMVVTYRVTAGAAGSSCPEPPPPPPPNARKPDLVISDFRVHEFTVTNRGAGPAAPFTVTVVGFEEFRIPGLAAGASARRTYSGRCAAEHRAVADSHAEVIESDETNNVATFTVVC